MLLQCDIPHILFTDNCRLNCQVYFITNSPLLPQVSFRLAPYREIRFLINQSIQRNLLVCLLAGSDFSNEQEKHFLAISLTLHNHPLLLEQFFSQQTLLPFFPFFFAWL